MRLVKVLLALLIILGILLVLSKNMVAVPVDLVTKKFENVQLAVVMIVTLAVGILVGFAIALTTIFSSKAEARAYRAENRRLSS
ncbi:MAG: lipopolysaccharide assembly protein LapA domain-containing protein, partial [Fidelibacterota bacterium]